MRPAQMLDHVADLRARLTDPNFYRAITRHVSLDFKGNAHSIPPEHADASAAASVSALRKAIEHVDSYYVAPDMTQLVHFASTQLDELDRFDTTLIPSQCGIVRFDGGLEQLEVRGQLLRTSWAVWGPILTSWPTDKPWDPPHEATGLWLFNDHFDEIDEIGKQLEANPDIDSDQLRRTMGRWGFIGTQLLYDQMRLGPPTIEPHADKVAQLHQEGVTDFTSITNPLRYMHAFFLMLGQQVAVVEDAELDRPTRRRADRRGIPARVVVIRLRHTSSGRSEGESLVEWSHRWLVKGHWRWQVCGKNHPLAQELEPGKWRARIWVAPYVKGPEGKPLVVSKKVYALLR